MSSEYPLLEKIVTAYDLSCALATMGREYNTWPKQRALPNKYYVDLHCMFGGLTDDNAWQYRELLRTWYVYNSEDLCWWIIDSGGTIEPEVATHQFKSLYIHHSLSDPVKVAYTPDAEKGKRDIQVTTTIGRLVKKLLPDTPDHVVQKLAQTWNAKYSEAEVRFGESQAEFIRAINNGPTESCMANLSYDGHIHPAAVYAAGDIQVAWVESDSRIVARTLINKSTRKFSRVYGDGTKLIPALERLEYEQATHALNGCLILRIKNENGNGYIMPYVDAGIGSGGGSLHFKHHSDDYFILDECTGTSTSVGHDYNGVSEPAHDEDSGSCDRCGSWQHTDDLHYSEYHSEELCESCTADYYRYVVTRFRNGQAIAEDYIRDDEVTYIKCLELWVADYALSRAPIVMDDYRGDYVHEDDAVRCITTDGPCHIDDAEECGRIDGTTIYIHETEVKGYAAKLYRDASGNLYWYESDEIVEWLSEGSERIKDEYILLSEFEDYAANKPKWVLVSEDRTPLPAGTPIRRNISNALFSTIYDARVVHDEGGEHILAVQFLNSTGRMRWVLAKTTEALM